MSPDGWTLLRGDVHGGPTLTGPFSREAPGLHLASPREFWVSAARLSCCS